MVKVNKNSDPLDSKYFFFLNPYDDQAFTKCPKCEGKTALRKFILMIFIKPQIPLMLNKKCRFCAKCELIITKKSEIENLMAYSMEEANKADVIGNDYDIIGTVDKKSAMSKDLSGVLVFKNIWDFEVTPAHWAKA